MFLKYFLTAVRRKKQIKVSVDDVIYVGECRIIGYYNGNAVTMPIAVIKRAECVNARDISSALNLCKDEWFFVASFNKEISKLITANAKNFVGGTNTTEAECKTIWNSFFSVARVTRGEKEILMLVSGFAIEVSLNFAVSEGNINVKKRDTIVGVRTSEFYGRVKVVKIIDERF